MGPKKQPPLHYEKFFIRFCICLYKIKCKVYIHLRNVQKHMNANHHPPLQKFLILPVIYANYYFFYRQLQTERDRAHHLFIKFNLSTTK